MTRHLLHVLLFVLVAVLPARAQTTITLTGATPAELLEDFGNRLGSPGTGRAVAAATALEVAVAPLGSPSGGLTFSFDRQTRTFSRASDSFGPAFLERADTSGRGKASVGFNVLHTKYDELAGLDLDDFLAVSIQGNRGSNIDGLGTLNVKTTTTALFGVVGITDDVDVAVSIPIVRIGLDGELRARDRDAGDTFFRAVLPEQSSTGLGDIGVQAKYRLWKPAAGADGARNGGVAAVVAFRLPTGDEEQLRGLGITRTELGAVVSGRASRLGPHASIAYELWSDSIHLPATFSTTGETVEVKNQLRFGVGTELVVSPRLTANVDLLVQRENAGLLDYRTFPAFLAGARQFDVLVATDGSVTRATLVPGFKWNAFGDGLLNVNVLVSLKSDSLRATGLTPSIGFDWTF